MATKIILDDETAAVLARFNEGLERTKEHNRRARVVAKAERAKEEAAKTVKRLDGDSDASPEDRSEAQEAYRAAVEHWQTAKERFDAGEDPTPPPEPRAEADKPQPEPQAEADEPQPEPQTEADEPQPEPQTEADEPQPDDSDA